MTFLNIMNSRLLIWQFEAYYCQITLCNLRKIFSSISLTRKQWFVNGYNKPKAYQTIVFIIKKWLNYEYTYFTFVHNFSFFNSLSSKSITRRHRSCHAKLLCTKCAQVTLEIGYCVIVIKNSSRSNWYINLFQKLVSVKKFVPAP